MSEAVVTPLGTLPSDWSVSTLADLTSVITDGAHYSPVPQEDGDLIANVKDMKSYGFDYDGCTRISSEDFVFLEKQNCSPRKNDILLSKDGTIGRVVHFDGARSVVLLSSIAIIRSNEKLEPSYLKHVLRSSHFDSQLYSMQSGSALKRIVLADIKKLLVPYPVRPEQRKIAKILSTVDDLIEKTQALIDKYQSIKQGMMHDLFTRGVDENGQLRPSYEEAPQLYKESELGWIPKEWDVVRLGDMGSFKNGLNKDKDSFGFGTKFVNISDVFPEKLNIGSLGRMDATKRELDDYKVSVGDILLDRSSVKLEGVGYPTIFMGAEEPVIFCGFIIRYQIQRSDVIPEFLLLMMRTPAFRQRVIRVATQSANVNINQEALSGVLAAVPTLEDQKKSIGVIQCINRDIASELEYLNKLSKIKSGLMQDLFTGKVRVKVDGVMNEEVH